MSSACKTAIKYSLFQSLRCLSYSRKMVPQVILNHLAATVAPDHTQPRQGHAVHLHLSCLVGFHSSLLSVRSHVLSSPYQTSNILHLGPSRYSIFRTIPFVASKFVLPCCLMGCIHLPTSLSSQIRRPWITCSSLTLVTSTTLDTLMPGTFNIRHFHHRRQPKLTQCRP
jgi:hypothetical protein